MMRTQCGAPAISRGNRMEPHMQHRRRFKQSQTLEKRLAAGAMRLREEAELLPPGIKREAALREARETETASHLSDWLRSPGLQPPK
jgi:hypothetical protein